MGRKRFSDEETLLLSLYEEEKIRKRLKSSIKRRKRAWEDLATILSALGYSRTGSEVKYKIKNLQWRYMKIRRNLRPGDSPPDWIFWRPMHRLFGPKTSAKTVPAVDTSVKGSSSIDTSGLSPSGGSLTSTPIPPTESSRSSSTDATSLRTSGGSQTSTSITPKKRREKCRTVEEDLLQVLCEYEKKSEARNLRMEQRQESMLQEMSTMASALRKWVDTCQANLPNLHTLETLLRHETQQPYEQFLSFKTHPPSFPLLLQQNQPPLKSFFGPSNPIFPQNIPKHQAMVSYETQQPHKPLFSFKTHPPPFPLPHQQDQPPSKLYFPFKSNRPTNHPNKPSNGFFFNCCDQSIHLYTV